MNLRDLLIIYLACGAPLGVYYFLQNRNRIETKILWLKTLLRFIVWIPFAIQMVAQRSLLTKVYKKGFDNLAESDAKKELEIEEIKKFFEKKYSENIFPFSIYEFREIYDRYVGLSLELQLENNGISPAEREIFRITNHTNKNIAEICLNRRNRKRLSFHQKLASGDFFEIFQQFLDKFADSRLLIEQAVKLSDLLNDLEIRKTLEILSKESLQTEDSPNVRTRENELWNSDKHKPLPETSISTNLQALTARANSSSKD